MRPHRNVATVAAALFGLGSIQAAVSLTAHDVQQVAIIGAGAAGSSAAYYLQNYAENAGVHVNITLFEKTDRIGGRTLTIDAYGDPSQPVELGASIFVQENEILYGALKDFGLPKSVPDENIDPHMGIWDGDVFVFSVNERHPSWWNTLKIIWKYGPFAPQRTLELVGATMTKFRRMYEEPFFPFPSLTERAAELGLLELTGVTGEQLLKANKVDDRFAHDIVQASTRVNYASNLARVHGLDTMVSMAAQGAMSVQGGNWRIFHKMVEKSGAAVALNTSVVGIEHLRKTGTGVSQHPQYTIRTESVSGRSTNAHPVAFHRVIIASPYQFSNISAGKGVLSHPIDEIPYVQLHVTIFASPYRCSPQFFNLRDGETVPGAVLTTLDRAGGPTSGPDGAGKAGFFSITILRTAVNPVTNKREYIYKIFSPRRVTPQFLSRLFAMEVPDTFVAQGGKHQRASPISWYYPHVFYSYPKAFPRVTFQDPIVGPGVYYTSGMDSFISTMETNALMGKNVARLVVDDILATNSAGVEEEQGKFG